MILDFKEIPRANTGNGKQDTFELFARDFFEMLGYKIIQHPDRGADGNKDLIVQEARQGISGTSHIKWLVSCKHYAHSGKSVSDRIESNILDRVNAHGCDGFIGFYSTLPSSGLGKSILGLKDKIEIQIFDHERIEKLLLENPKGLKLASRYFPKSFDKYSIENPKPAKIFLGEPALFCEYCGRNLLEDKTGIFVLMREFSYSEEGEYIKMPYSKAYFSCKGEHDRILKNKYLQGGSYIDEWVNISDFTYPIGYIRNIMAWMNFFQLENGKIENEAFNKLKTLFINTFPYVARELTEKERGKVKEYLQLGFVDYL